MKLRSVLIFVSMLPRPSFGRKLCSAFLLTYRQIWVKLYLQILSLVITLAQDYYDMMKHFLFFSTNVRHGQICPFQKFVVFA